MPHSENTIESLLPNSSNAVLYIVLLVGVAWAFYYTSVSIEPKGDGNIASIASVDDSSLSRITIGVPAQSNSIENIHCTYDGDALVAVPLPHMIGQLPAYMDTENSNNDFTLKFEREESNPSNTAVIIPWWLTDTLQSTVTEPEFKVDMQVLYVKAAKLCSHAHTTLSTWTTK